VARIKLPAAVVISNLEAAPVVSGHSEERSLAAVNPCWQLRLRKAQVARRCARRRNFLTSGSDRGRQEREDFPEPGTRSKNILVSLQDFSGTRADSLHAVFVIEPGVTCACRYWPPSFRNAFRTASHPRRAARKPESGSKTLQETPQNLPAANVWCIRRRKVSRIEPPPLATLQGGAFVGIVAPAIRRAPPRKKSFTFHRCSYSCNNARPLHIFAYKSCVGPYVARIVRVSPPELAREFPGPSVKQCNVRATLHELECRPAPNAPAPTTITETGFEPASTGVTGDVRRPRQQSFQK